MAATRSQRSRESARPPIPVELHNAVLAKALDRVDRLEGRLARIIEPILAEAGREAAARFDRLATNHLVAAAANTDVSSASMMVCVRPRPHEAAAIADPDGDPPEILHVTLCYLGENDDEQAVADAAEALKPVAASFAPLEGVVGGYGVFDPAGVGVLLPDVRGLAELRVAVCEALLDAGIDYARDHGFSPHISVHSDPTDAAQAAALERAAGEALHFDALVVVRGNAEEVELRLVGVPALTAAGPPPQWTAPFPDELINIESLVAQILAKTDPVRLAMIEQTMTPALRAAGLAWDVTNPLTAKVLASTASQVTGIAETTQVNLMRIIRSAYQNGLSIPQTSSLIREGMAAASKTRATMIARTELCRAVSGGSLAATQLVADATGSKYVKRWNSTPGAKYPRHEDYDGLDGQTVALDATFTVGADQLQYPGDPNGSPEETIACRCAITYQTPEGEQTANAEDPPELDSGNSAGGGGGGGPLTLPSQPLSAHLTALEGTDPAGLASSLVAQAKAFEPALTEAMKSSADATGAKLVGLDKRLKGAESAARKIAEDSRVRGQTARQTAYEVADMARYTATFPVEQYTGGVRSMLSDLQKRGMTVSRFRNTWETGGAYRGINIQMLAPNGYKYELQFHTPASWEMKNGELHSLYEQYRVLDPESAPAKELWQKMLDLSGGLTEPAGVQGLDYQTAETSVNIGVTPFRPEDDPIGFYDSAKFQQFTDQLYTTAPDYGVTVDRVENATGVWQGETEPSVSIAAHDGQTGLQAFAASLGRSYNQDGVLIFGKQAGGDIMATFAPAQQDELIAAMKQVGIDGGRITADGRLEVIGSGPEFVRQIDELGSILGTGSVQHGTFTLLESGDYSAAQQAHAAAQSLRTVADLVPGAPASTLASVTDSIDTRLVPYAEKHGMTPDEYRAAALDSIRRAVENASVRLRIEPDKLASVLKDGRYKTQFETGASKGLLSNDIRASAEKSMFGYPLDLAPELRPVYGYLAGSASETGPIGGYGDIVVNLKTETNARTTFSLSDSLGYGNAGGLAPPPLLDPSLAAWPPGTDPVAADGVLRDLSNGNYVEAQIHGGVTPNDIAEVVFSRSKEQDAIDATESLARTYAARAADPNDPGSSYQSKSDVVKLASDWRAIADTTRTQGDQIRAELDALGIAWRIVEDL